MIKCRRSVANNFPLNILVTNLSDAGHNNDYSADYLTGNLQGRKTE
jgi:hypothetical protein